MKRWKVIDGPERRNARVDGEVWGCVIENVNDPAQRRFIGVTLVRSMLQTEPDRLIAPVREAIETKGLSVIERYLDLPEPPEMFIVSAEQIAVQTGE